MGFLKINHKFNSCKNVDVLMYGTFTEPNRTSAATKQWCRLFVFTERDSSFRPGHVPPNGCHHLCHQCQHSVHRSAGELE